MALTRVRNGMRFMSFFTPQRGGKRSGMLQTESVFPIASEMRDTTFEASPLFEKSSPNLVAQTHANLASGISNYVLQAGIRHFSSRIRLTVDLCINCKQPGHIARECTNEKACHNCGQSGHLAAVCTEEPLCYRCLQRGHRAAFCPRNTYSNKICYNCKQKGHYASVCPLPAACNNCHLSGHLARDCTATKACHRCGQEGHLARHCPQGVVAEEDPPCLTCGLPGHSACNCPTGEGEKSQQECSQLTVVRL